MGVRILPRLAAMVCSTITGIICFLCPVIVRINMARGTKVIKATSFVIHIEEKKHSSTSTKVMDLTLATRVSSFFDSRTKTPVLL